MAKMNPCCACDPNALPRSAAAARSGVIARSLKPALASAVMDSTASRVSRGV